MLRLQDFVTGKVPKESVKPLAFMQPLADWSYTKAYLDRLRTSDIVATGRNHRDEFGALQTALSQFAYIPELTKVLSDYPGLEFKISDDFRTNYTRYLIDLQNPDTGFWGPSYRFQGSSDTVELQDIAFSFHIVHYWKESGIRIPRPRQIADTILDYGVQNEVHPYGWLTDHKDKFRYSNHNNFDTLILLKYSWSGLDAAQRDYATTKLQMLFEWCLKESLSPKGDCFERFRGPVTVDDYYYGVCFLDDIGFWDTDAAFRPIALWPGAPEPKALARSLLDGFLAHKWTTTKPGEHVVRILRKYT